MSIQKPVLPEYSGLADIIRKASITADPSELHGSFCGAAVLLGPHAGAIWLKESLAECDPDNVLSAEAGKALGGIAINSFRMLEEGDMSIDLLLPTDDEAIQFRTECLGLWCQGFLHGIALGNAGDDSAPAEKIFETDVAKEIVADFSEITKAEADESDPEQAENDYFELVEYVRVSVQLIFEETGSLRGDEKSLNS